MISSFSLSCPSRYSFCSSRACWVLWNDRTRWKTWIVFPPPPSSPPTALHIIVYYWIFYILSRLFSLIRVTTMHIFHNARNNHTLVGKTNRQTQIQSRGQSTSSLAMLSLWVAMSWFCCSLCSEIRVAISVEWASLIPAISLPWTSSCTAIWRWEGCWEIKE